MTDSSTHTPEENAQLVTEYLEAGWNRGDFDSEAVSDDYVVHLNRPENKYTFDEMQSIAASWRDAFPDLRLEILDVIATERKVAVRYRWTGTHEAEVLEIEPTGTTVDVNGMAHFRIAEGSLAEAWYTEDVFGLHKQLRSSE